MAVIEPRSVVVVAEPTAANHPTTRSYVDTGLATKSPTGHTHASPAAHAGSHAFGGTDPVSPASIGAQSLDADLTAIAALSPSDGSLLSRAAGAWSSITTAALKTALVLVKADVGLGSVDNTSDVAKPVSTAQNTAIGFKRDELEPPATKTASYTLSDLDHVVIFNTTIASMVATLPTAVGRSGRRFTVKKLGGSTINMLTIASNGGTIDGLVTEIISVSGGFRELISDGTNWHIVGGGVLPVITTLTTISTGNINIDASVGSLYRITVTGATAALPVPTNAIDGDVINVEVYASTVAVTLTINASIIEAGGLAASYVIPIGKVLHLALRFRNVAPAGWRLLASSSDN